jgi:hypothetical protein
MPWAEPMGLRHLCVGAQMPRAIHSKLEASQHLEAYYVE